MSTPMAADVDDAFNRPSAGTAVGGEAGAGADGGTMEAGRKVTIDQRRMRAPGTRREADLNSFAPTAMQRSLVYVSMVVGVCTVLAFFVCLLIWSLCADVYYSTLLGMLCALAASASAAGACALLGWFTPVKKADKPKLYMPIAAKWLLVAAAVLCLLVAIDAGVAMGCEDWHNRQEWLALYKQEHRGGNGSGREKRPREDMHGFCGAMRGGAPCKQPVRFDYSTPVAVWVGLSVAMVASLLGLALATIGAVAATHFVDQAAASPRLAMRPFRLYVLRARYNKMAEAEAELYPDEMPEAAGADAPSVDTTAGSAGMQGATSGDSTDQTAQSDGMEQATPAADRPVGKKGRKAGRLAAFKPPVAAAPPQSKEDDAEDLTRLEGGPPPGASVVAAKVAKAKASGEQHMGPSSEAHYQNLHQYAASKENEGGGTGGNAGADIIV